MSKRLISTDYSSFLSKIEENKFEDIYNLTLSFCEEHFQKNNDICLKLFNNIKDDLYINSVSSNALLIKNNKHEKDIDLFTLSDDLLEGLTCLFNLHEAASEIKNPEIELEITNKIFNYISHLIELQFESIPNPSTNYFLTATKLNYFAYCLCLINYAIQSQLNQEKYEDSIPFKNLERLYSVCIKFEELNSLDIKDVFKRKIKIEKFLNTINSENSSEQKNKATSVSDNIFNNVPLIKVREIFSVLTTKKNSISPPSYFLSDNELDEFINCAFLGQDLVNTINIKYNPEKDIVRLKHLFHTFKTYSKNYESQDRTYRNEDYVKLFVDYFNTSQTIEKFGNNFSKAPRQKDKVLIKIEDIK